MNHWKLAVFDLDGVLTDTARHHFMAWKETLESLQIPVDDEVCELVKGISRAESLALILKRAKITMEEAQFQRVLEDKNAAYLHRIEGLTKQDILPGIEQLLQSLQEDHILCAVASASKSAPRILKQLEIDHYFAHIADPSKIAKGKPAPDIFLEPCTYFHISPREAVGFEDAAAGVQAIKAAGLYAIGIGHEQLKQEHPDQYYASTKELSYPRLQQLVKER